MKRRIDLTDPWQMKHFVEKIYMLNTEVKPLAGSKPLNVIKTGGFGQPVAAVSGNKGAFWGLEYPSSVNKIEQVGNSLRVSNEELEGTEMNRHTLSSDWIVAAVTPDTCIKKWFFAYLDDIRVAPLRPYALYNTWYDLRSEPYGVAKDNIMNERNVMRQIQELKTNMIEQIRN